LPARLTSICLSQDDSSITIPATLAPSYPRPLAIVDALS
jgi:hypothetical protein